MTGLVGAQGAVDTWGAVSTTGVSGHPHSGHTPVPIVTPLSPCDPRTHPGWCRSRPCSPRCRRRPGHCGDTGSGGSGDTQGTPEECPHWCSCPWVSPPPQVTLSPGCPPEVLLGVTPEWHLLLSVPTSVTHPCMPPQCHPPLCPLGWHLPLCVPLVLPVMSPQCHPQCHHSATPVPPQCHPSTSTVPTQCHPQCHPVLPQCHPSAIPTVTPVPPPLPPQCHPHCHCSAIPVPPQCQAVPGGVAHPLGHCRLGRSCRNQGRKRWNSAGVGRRTCFRHCPSRQVGSSAGSQHGQRGHWALLGGTVSPTRGQRGHWALLSLLGISGGIQRALSGHHSWRQAGTQWSSQ